MPRVDPTEYESLSLEAFQLVQGFALHDVWLVELEDSTSCTVQDLRSLVTPERLRFLGPAVRILFFLRAVLGRTFRLDSAPGDESARCLVEKVPAQLANASLVPPGTPAGPFATLYALPSEAAYQALNATVHAILIVTLTKSVSGHRFFWATYVKPVGRITSLYMRVIDPFRRAIVYPGLESWLKRAWLERCRDLGCRLGAVDSNVIRNDSKEAKMRINVRALALACGLLWGVGLFFLTWWIILFDGPSSDPTFLSRIYRGYTVTPVGSVVGLGWGLTDGAIGGAIFAWLYNALAGSKSL